MTFEEWYESLLPLLLRDAVRRFRVPFEDAQDIAHDAFLSFLMKQDQVLDPKKYLIGAVSHGCRTYWRKQERELGEPLPGQRGATPPYMATITVHRVLVALPPREREVLMLRAAGFRIKEIAVRIAYSPGGVEKVLRRAKQRAASLIDPPDETERWRVGGGVAHQDTHECASARRPSCVSPPAQVPRSTLGMTGWVGGAGGLVDAMMEARKHQPSSRASSEGPGWAGRRRRSLRRAA